MTCKTCKYWNRKRVVQPKGSGMCENTRSEHKAVKGQDFTCKHRKEGTFRKEYIVFTSK